MFRVNYSLETGEVVSYQEGNDCTIDAVPEGCGMVLYKDPYPGFVNDKGAVTMRVVEGRLAPLVKTEIPEPLPNPTNAATKT